MAIEIKVPTLGESVTEATVGQWFKQQGEEVKADEPLVELETDKVTQEIYAPASGVLGEIVVQQGETVGIGAILASLNDGATGGETTTKSQSENPGSASTAAPAASAAAAPAPANDTAPAGNGSGSEMPPSPAARKALAESGQSASDVEGSGRRGQVLKHDVAAAQSSQPQQQSEPPEYSAPAAYVPANIPTPAQNLRIPSSEVDSAREERVRMSRLRQTVARRLKDAQNTAAVLTTFNDVDMTAVMDMRKQYKDLFEKRHGVKLGFMGFFVKACIQALREIPAVNAEIDGTDIIYKNYYHIGVAVGSDKGLVVPVVRNAEAMSIAEIEATIGEYGKRARSGQLSIEDMQGGTFTISNGGVYGSLMSTPILNAPQSGILGMHRIEQRPVVLPDGSIAARPMMYLALSYDHRLVDGKEAVTFLVRVKECLEDPHRFVLDL